MSKRIDLERQLEECKRAEEYLTAVIANLGNLHNSVKAKLWDEVAPLVKQVIEERMKGVLWATIEKPFQQELTDRVMRHICGAEVRDHLGKL